MSLVELAPRHKRGLTLRGPVVNAAGTLGFAVEAEGIVDFERLGGFITNPITFESRGPANAPNVAATAEGIALHTGIPNPGIKAALRRFTPDGERVFGRQGVPVIVHLAATRPVEVRRAVEWIERVDVVSGLELGLRDDLNASEMTEVVHAARGNVPLIVRLPIDKAERFAPVAARSGADALCVGAPPRWRPTAPSPDLPRSGRLYGQGVFEATLAAVRAVASMSLDTPIVGAGGVIDRARVDAVLEAGAVAVQVDLALWRDLDLAG